MIELVISGGKIGIHAEGRDVERRFVAKVAFAGIDECWEWTGCLAGKGYGFFRINPARRSNAHRVAYELWTGPIPPGVVIDHVCRNHACVNPNHLEAVASSENQERGNRNQFSGTMECVNSHRFTPENTYFATNGERHCRQCGRLSQRRYKARKRGTID